MPQKVAPTNLDTHEEQLERSISLGWKGFNPHLNFVATLRMISEQYQVPYWNLESFTTSSRLALFGTLLDVL